MLRLGVFFFGGAAFNALITLDSASEDSSVLESSTSTAPAPPSLATPTGTRLSKPADIFAAASETTGVATFGFLVAGAATFQRRAAS